MTFYCWWDKIDKKRIAEIRERCESATPGPWRTVVLGNTVKSLQIISHCVCKKICSGISPKSKDADFIVHARVDIPYLLGEIESLQGELTEWEKSCETRDQMLVDQAAQIAELKEKYDRINDFEQTQCAKLLVKLSEFQRREQAAVKDLSEYAIGAYNECGCCAFKTVRGNQCDNCRDGSKWQWRGPQAECEIAEHIESCHECAFCKNKEGDGK